jgi:hypothetical protein
MNNGMWVQRAGGAFRRILWDGVKYLFFYPDGTSAPTSVEETVGVIASYDMELHSLPSNASDFLS